VRVSAASLRGQTYTAHILCAINPFKELPIYDEKHVQQYRNKSIGSEPPHVFAIGAGPVDVSPLALHRPPRSFRVLRVSLPVPPLAADNAYRNMKNNNISQSIIVSGTRRPPRVALDIAVLGPTH